MKFETKIVFHEDVLLVLVHKQNLNLQNESVVGVRLV